MSRRGSSPHPPRSTSFPEEDIFVQPGFTADRDWLHLEARYNYEALDTGSAWVGYDFGGGEAVTWELTPMLGAVFGATDGIAPGYKGTLGWKNSSFTAKASMSSTPPIRRTASSTTGRSSPSRPSSPSGSGWSRSGRGSTRRIARSNAACLRVCRSETRRHRIRLQPGRRKADVHHGARTDVLNP